MASWDAWVSQFRRGGYVDKVTLYAADRAYDVPPENTPSKGPSPLASDYDINALDYPKEKKLHGLLAWGQLTTILDAMADTSDVKSVQSGGFKVGDDKFICLRSDDTRLYGKMGKDGGILCYKYHYSRLLIVCHYPGQIPDGNAVNDVEGGAALLKKALEPQ